MVKDDDSEDRQPDEEFPEKWPGRRHSCPRRPARPPAFPRQAV